MGDDLIPILTRFHREIVLPDIQWIVGMAVDDFRLCLNSHVVEIHKRFDRLEIESVAIAAGVKRVEERLERVEQCLDKLDAASEPRS